MTITLAPSMNSLPPAVTKGRSDPRRKFDASSINRATKPEAGLASSVAGSSGYWRAQSARTLWMSVSVCGSPDTRAWVCSMTGETSSAPTPTTAASVPATVAVSPNQRVTWKRRSSTSVTADKYTAHSAAMNTRSSTSTTRMKNQMARAATKSATNVAPDDREVDGSAFSGGARRRRPRPARPRSRPCRAVSTHRRTRRGAGPACASARAAARRRPPSLPGSGTASPTCRRRGRRSPQPPLLVLDLLAHALERLEHALVADRGHRFLDALVRLGALLTSEEDVLPALRLLDPVVQLAERQLELLGFLAVLHPRLVQLHCALRVLVVPQQRLLRQIVPPFLHGEHGPALPVLGALLFLVDLRRQALLVRDGRRHLLLRLRQLIAHIHDQLVQHLLRILGAGDQVADVRPDQRRQTVKDSHEHPRCPESSLSRAQLALPPLGEHALGEI